MSQPTQKQVVGALGETVVAHTLERIGFKILERNYRKKWGELDVIAQKATIIHFIEVKTKLCQSEIEFKRAIEYRPEENVHFHKLRRLRRAVQTYLLDRNIPPTVIWKFDVAVVFLLKSPKRAKIRWLRDIPL